MYRVEGLVQARVAAPKWVCLFFLLFEIPAARGQSVNIPLQLEYTDGVRLIANIGTGGQAPKPYIFDTGSSLFNLQYATSVFGTTVPASMPSPSALFPNGLPTGVSYSYVSGLSFKGNLVGVPSISFYPTSTFNPSAAVTLNAKAADGSATNFVVNALYEIDGQPITSPKPLGSYKGGFGDAYGVFGAGFFATNEKGTTVNKSSIGVGGVLGQAVQPGLTAGYVIAANGTPLNSLNTSTLTIPGATQNGPQVGQSVTSCSPCVMLGLTPALLAQFRPANTMAWIKPENAIPFWNSNVSSGLEFGVRMNISVAGTDSYHFTNYATLLDSGKPNIQLSNTSFTPKTLTDGKITIAAPNGGATATVDAITPSTTAASPYDVRILDTLNDTNGVGISFFLQNSVMFNLQGQVVGYTPNFVTDTAIETKAGSPLQIGSDSVPLGLAGLISGPGGLTIGNGGSATLSADNTYTGPTVVDGGNLTVLGSIVSPTTIRAGGVLQGTGTVADVTVAGGTFAPGDGSPGSTMTVQGTLSFSNGGRYGVLLDPQSASSATVGVAKLTGGTVDARFASGTYVAKSYEILRASAVEGTFDALLTTDLPSTFSAALDYTATSVLLNLALAPTTTLVANHAHANKAVVDYFNRGGLLSPGFASLVEMDPDAQQSGYTQISGEPAAGIIQGAFDANNIFMNAIFGSIDEVGGSAGDGMTSSARADNASLSYADAGTSAARGADAYAALQRATSATAQPRWTVWASGYGGASRTNGDASFGTSTVTDHVYGALAGALYRSSDNVLGFATGGAGLDSDTAVGLGSAHADIFQVGLFERHNFGALYLVGAAAWSWQNTSTQRQITVSSTDDLHASFNANALSGRAEAGWWIGKAEARVAPYAAVQPTVLYLPAYAESAVSGSNQFALSYDAKTATNVRTELGARVEKLVPNAGGNVALHLRAGWLHDSSTDRQVTATFQTLPGATFNVSGAQPAADSALFEAGAEMRWRNGFALAGTFETELSNTTSTYAGKVRISYPW